MRRWIGGGRCTCVQPVAENGPCPACMFSIDTEEFVREHPVEDPDRDAGLEVSERMYEAHLDRIGGTT